MDLKCPSGVTWRNFPDEDLAFDFPDTPPKEGSYIDVQAASGLRIRLCYTEENSTMRELYNLHKQHTTFNLDECHTFAILSNSNLNGDLSMETFVDRATQKCAWINLPLSYDLNASDAWVSDSSSPEPPPPKRRKTGKNKTPPHTQPIPTQKRRDHAYSSTSDLANTLIGLDDYAQTLPAIGHNIITPDIRPHNAPPQFVTRVSHHIANTGRTKRAPDYNSPMEWNIWLTGCHDGFREFNN
jgi:hypothetical protein